MPSEITIHVAIELSSSSWLVATRLPGAEKSRLRRLEGGDTTGLLALLTDLRRQASTKPGCATDVACCFEAGRDGFWLHRLLTAQGFASYVLEPTSILVNRRARRAKTCQRALNTPHNGALKIPWIPDAAASPEPVSGRR